MKSKRCPKCREIKPINEFYKHNKYGYRSYCKKCNSELSIEYSKNNPEKIREIWGRHYKNNIRNMRERSRKHTLNNPNYSKEYRLNNCEEVRERLKKWRIENPEYYKKWRSIPKNNLSKRISGSIYSSLKNDKNNNHWEKLVNYNLQDLIIHLENQFEDGMTWQNMGEWHIDHIIPISLWEFESYNDREFKQCWALANLQPLWAYDNISKGAKI